MSSYHKCDICPKIARLKCEICAAKYCSARCQTEDVKCRGHRCRGSEAARAESVGVRIPDGLKDLARPMSEFDKRVWFSDATCQSLRSVDVYLIDDVPTAHHLYADKFVYTNADGVFMFRHARGPSAGGKLDWAQAVKEMERPCGNVFAKDVARRRQRRAQEREDVLVPETPPSERPPSSAVVTTPRLPSLPPSPVLSPETPSSLPPSPILSPESYPPSGTPQLGPTPPEPVRRRIEEDRNPPYIPEIGDSFHWDWDPTTYREYVVKEVIRDEHGYVTAIRAADSLRLQRSLMDFTYDHQKRRWFNVTYNNYMAAVDVWWKSPGDR